MGVILSLIYGAGEEVKLPPSSSIPCREGIQHEGGCRQSLGVVEGAGLVLTGPLGPGIAQAQHQRPAATQGQRHCAGPYCHHRCWQPLARGCLAGAAHLGRRETTIRAAFPFAALWRGYPTPHLKCLCILLTADELLAVGDIQQPSGHLQDSPGGIWSLEHDVLVPICHSPGTQQQSVCHVLLVPGVDTAQEEKEDEADSQKNPSLHPHPAQASPAIGRVLIAQIHGYGHESAGHPGIGNNPQVSCLVPAEPGEAVVCTPMAVGGQLRGTGEMGEWLRSQDWPLWFLPGIFSTWQDASMCLQHPLPGHIPRTTCLSPCHTCTKPKGRSGSVCPADPMWNAWRQSAMSAGKVQLYLSVFSKVLSSPVPQREGLVRAQWGLLHAGAQKWGLTLVPSDTLQGHVEQWVDHGVPEHGGCFWTREMLMWGRAERQR